MSDSPRPPQEWDGGGFDSRDCVDLVVDCKGDTTIRPLTGKRREWAMAERERIARWQEYLRQQGQTDEKSG